MEGAAADAAEDFFAAMRANKAPKKQEAEADASASSTTAADAGASSSSAAAADAAPAEADASKDEGDKPMSGEAADAADAFFASMRKERNGKQEEEKPMANDVADAADSFFAAMRAARGEGQSSKSASSSSAAPAPMEDIEQDMDESGDRALKGFVVDSAAMQGRSPKQEDKHAKVPDFSKAAKALKMPIDHFGQPCAFFAVYDGFRGVQCAEFVAKQFHLRLLKRLSANTDLESWTDDAVKESLSAVFEEIDTDFMAKYRTANDGSTVVVALILGLRLFVAWLGNCRSFVCSRGADGVPTTASLTKDHRPSESEADRIKEAGGVIVDMGDGVPRLAHEGFDERIRELRRAEALGMGVIGKVPNSLSVSRAMGDREFKAVMGKALLIATPGVECFKLDPSAKFLTLVCGGISDVMTDEDVVKELLVVRDRSSAAANVRAGCGAVVSEAYKRGSMENLTIIVAALEWEGISVMRAFRKRGLIREEAAPIPVESAAVASKKRRMAAAAVVTAQKREAHDRAVAAEATSTAAPAAEPAAAKNGVKASGAAPAAAPAAKAATAGPSAEASPAPAAAAAPTAATAPAAAGATPAAEKPVAPKPEAKAAAAKPEAKAAAAKPEGKAAAAKPEGKAAAKPEGKPAKKRVLV